MTFVLIILAVVVIAVLYFAFQKKAAGPAERKPAGELREPPSSQPMSSRAPPPPRRDSGPVGRAPTAAAAAAEVKEIEEDILIQEAPAVIETRPSLVHVRDIESLRRGLEKSRKAEGFFGRLVALLGGKKEIGKEIAAQIEEVLLSSDVGVQTTQTMLTRINEMLSRADLVDSGRVWDALRTEARRILH
ncbi:MAG TPA: signal recognition particle receptor subunit alpha, partial [Polyangiaceae bacterium]